MATEPNKTYFFHPVKREPVVEQAAAAVKEDGILFQGLAETVCPHCKAAVPLSGAEPLSTLLCPACGGKVFVPGRLGGFLLYAHIGEGEMGAIYRATDESLNREVAIKLVRGCQADDPVSRERLRCEACAAGKLNHPRVAQVYALNFSNGHPYLVMELVAGQDFAQKLDREGRIEERVALRMALDVADGLSALNREGLVHGDIKPGNIVLDRDGNAKLVDFGLSGMTRFDDNGTFVGSPYYIAPEVLRGGADTHRSDIYSLGATLYHLLSGRPLHEGNTLVDIIKARLFHKSVPIGTLSPHVSVPTLKMVLRMLEPDPKKRQASSDEVAAEIRNALARLDGPAPVTRSASDAVDPFFDPQEVSPRPQLPAPPPRRFASIAVILGLVVAIGLLLATGDRSFEQVAKWLHLQAAGSKEAGAPTQPEAAAPVLEDASYLDLFALPAGQLLPETAAPLRDEFSAEAKPSWQSINLGDNMQRGSTMQMGGTMIIQGTGTDMYKGYERYRFVWTKASENYAFSAQVLAIADNNSLTVTGLLVKGDDPASGPSLLFGFLGNGTLFLQIRRPDDKALIVKRSEQPVPLPCYLRIIRRGKTFETRLSGDGQAWGRFAACELDLPTANTLGFAVCAQDTNTLATAKFDGIHLLTQGQPGAAKARGPR